jgi:hypothetical protein
MILKRITADMLIMRITLTSKPLQLQRNCCARASTALHKVGWCKIPCRTACTAAASLRADFIRTAA